MVREQSLARNDDPYVVLLILCRYHRMDGSTNVAVRARLVDDFNSNDSVFLFLLTTKVGGLGINLTGADRCSSRSYPCVCRLIKYSSCPPLSTLGLPCEHACHACEHLRHDKYPMYPDNTLRST